MDKLINITSIFLSIDGEINMCGAGGWSVFIRFQGCTAQCLYCDSKYTWKKDTGKQLTIVEILEQVKLVGQNVRKVTITGGEPLEQLEGFKSLMRRLLLAGYVISVETNGLHSVKAWSGRYSNLGFVLDYKLPSSGAAFEKTNIKQFENLSENDYIKFVISDMRDFEYAVRAVEHLFSRTDAHMYFSPCVGTEMTGAELFVLMKKYNLPPFQVGINVQIHKYIFPDDIREEEK